MFLNKQNIKKQSSGYTLIEILIVVSLVMVTCLALSSATLQGVRLFMRIGMNGQDRQASLMLDQLSRDLRSMTNYSGIVFKYEFDEMIFARRFFSDDSGEMGMSEVSYLFDTESGSVTRKEKNLATTERAESIKNRKMISFLKNYDLKIEGDQYRNPRVITLQIAYDGYFGLRQIERKWSIPSSWIP